jgi:PncC family amidohydrolase
VSISSAARRVARLLKATDRKVVFAESCTGGLVSGALTAIPGISDCHCGGMVAYRNESKITFLGIPRKLIHKVGPVSAEVASLMAQNVLALTSEADIATSVTGHLGPGAPPQLDGLVFVAIAQRAGKGRSKPHIQVHEVHCRARDSRVVRQRWVIERVLELLGNELEPVYL